MTIYSAIMDFANKNTGRFCIKDLLSHIQREKLQYQRATVANALAKLTSDNTLKRCGFGIYEVAQLPKKEFKTSVGKKVRQLQIKLKKDFPFADICVWNISDLNQLPQHIPNADFTIVEVEKDIVDSVATRLREQNNLLVLVNPTLKEMETFGNHKNLAIVKPFISQNPLNNFDGFLSPTLEKILVDILCDGAFHFLTGMELEHIYRNAFDSFNLDAKTLKRYASRRNKQKDVSSLLEAIQ